MKLKVKCLSEGFLFGGEMWPVQNVVLAVTFDFKYWNQNFPGIPCHAGLIMLFQLSL